MTPETLQTNWLSLRYWLTRCVLPAVIVLLGILMLLKMVTVTPRDLDHKAVIVGFFTLYYILVRGGHILMTRSLHKELQKKYDDKYREKLASFEPSSMKRRNIGFTLARIKRELIDDKRATQDLYKR